jgi:fructose-specific phosphotransferase system IIA component
MEPHCLADLLHPQSVLVPLVAADRQAAIEALVSALPFDRADNPEDRQELIAAVLAREQAGSTGIGEGVAIPHARSAKLSSPRLSVGLSERPIDFNAADGKPVTLIFLLAVPVAAPKSHLKALAALSRVVMDKKLLRQLTKANSAEDLYALLAERQV